MTNLLNTNVNSTDTIVALATAPGRAGIAIVRVSGPLVTHIAQHIVKQLPTPRFALHTLFQDIHHTPIDEGIAIFFKAPHSFTGEDVLELQGHGGPAVVDVIIETVLQLGARLAKPGEFSERAFLNDKLDLAQAEAIADLIDATSQQAARSAFRSLQGDFSDKIHALVQSITHLRMYVEAAIDFAEEEIDFLADGQVGEQLENCLAQLIAIKGAATQGRLLREGITVVIAGEPNVGKSSLLNALSGNDSAIVTDIAGTTRDVLREHISIDGMPLHIIDTAGLRESADIVEQEGIRRAHQEIQQADIILHVVSALDPLTKKIPFESALMPTTDVVLVRNKIDLMNEAPQLSVIDNQTVISLSAKANQGLALLTNHIKSSVGFAKNTEGSFSARRRHMDALNRAHELLINGQQQLNDYRAGELLAEDLRQAQGHLSQITGEFTSDDLLGEIFSSFCIGK